ncbi:MAG: hypothetical protein FD175_2199 [Beijerinckiaceae bacterium]|nr:MAG: hypothetical protein FD175_2199 [Beijerinckiaceae bacterium]
MVTIASTPPFEPHPSRHAILAEAHARPFFRLEVPARILALAFLRGDVPAATVRERLDAFARAHGAAPAPSDAKHHRMLLPQGLFRWEEHTEFTTFVFMLSGDAARFDLTGGELLRALALPEQPGPHLVSVDMSFIPETQAEMAMSHVQSGVISVSALEDGRARVASDFIPDESGFVRFVVVNRDLPDRRLGSLARDIMEIEVYRSLALLGLPEAQRIGPIVREIERGLADLMGDLVHQQSLEEGDALLSRLTDMTARAEAEIARTKFRFGATRAYGAILSDRLSAFGVSATPDAPTIAAFLTRRNAPALRTCETMEANLVDLAARLTRASGLLRTRIDVELAKQNNALLGGMSERTRLQLRLQQTVEGLSVAAISYYVVGLVGYLLKAGKEAHLLPLPLDLAIGISVPLVVLAMALVVRRIRHTHTREGS